ncbi:MAG TPA: hypothetical protein DCS48_14040 [Desulfovibrio sp.]|nr:hypothetical protein [Desulfovibrio sp.]
MLFGRFKILLLTILLLLGISVGSARAEGHVVYLSSLEWPPYAGEHLPENGSNAKIIRKAFAVMGYKLKILFRPWKRTMLMADNAQSVIGYFPAYYSHERAKKYILSNCYSCSPVSLLERRESPVSWNTVDDLAGLRVGFVAGYVNTPELDEAVANGTITADLAPSDKSNIMKVIKGRVDCAVVDPMVYGYLAATDNNIGKHIDRLQIEPRAFGVNELFVAFKRSGRGSFYVRVLNDGLRKIGVRENCEYHD